jgi:hypothetical protein
MAILFVMKMVQRIFDKLFCRKKLDRPATEEGSTGGPKILLSAGHSLMWDLEAVRQHEWRPKQQKQH